MAQLFGPTCRCPCSPTSARLAANFLSRSRALERHISIMRLLVFPSDVGKLRSEPAPASSRPLQVSLEALLDMARRGDPRTGVALFDRFAQPVNRIVWRLLGGDESHDDIVHEVFVALMGGLRRVRDSSTLEGWVAVVTVNKVRSEIRRRRIFQFWHVDAPESFESVEAPMHPHEVHELLRRTYRALDTLPANERIAFILRFIDEQPLAVVAEACGCSLATIKRRLCSARARFGRLAARDPVLAERLAEGAERMRNGPR